MNPAHNIREILVELWAAVYQQNLFLSEIDGKITNEPYKSQQLDKAEERIKAIVREARVSQIKEDHENFERLFMDWYGIKYVNAEGNKYKSSSAVTDFRLAIDASEKEQRAKLELQAKDG